MLFNILRAGAVLWAGLRSGCRSHLWHPAQADLPHALGCPAARVEPQPWHEEQGAVGRGQQRPLTLPGWHIAGLILLLQAARGPARRQLETFAAAAGVGQNLAQKLWRDATLRDCLHVPVSSPNCGFELTGLAKVQPLRLGCIGSPESSGFLAAMACSIV